ncbi:hypothetical protein LJR118_005822 [Acidovorax sp. LjRoot118]|uniref:hypothetical protein n=1 Tax=unclassified Acidovorax TaxID=2684926 RepID=UPI0012F81A39|nr:hypothetical protein [Acidovorax sp. Root217]
MQRPLDAPQAESATLAAMSYTSIHTAFAAAAPMGMAMMLPAFTRAMGARMITTITPAAT